MDGAFRATYCRKRFRQKYNAIKRNVRMKMNASTQIKYLKNNCIMFNPWTIRCFMLNPQTIRCPVYKIPGS